MTGMPLEQTDTGNTVTLRAVLLGLVSVVCMCWLVDYELHVAGPSVMTLANFPICALLMFVGWVIVNSLLRLLMPTRVLRPAELLTIMVMCWAAGMMAGRGWSGYLTGLLSSMQHFASPENRWEELLGKLLPPWLFPEPMGDAARTEAGNWFYTGLPEGQLIPWKVWVLPVFWWSTAAVAVLGMTLSVTVIFHRQWVTYERLSFPLATVPMMLVEVRPGERVAPIFKNRLFWIGFAVVAGPLIWNLGGYLFHGWPKLGIYKTAWQLRRYIIRGFPFTAFRIMPPVIGFLYLCNLDLLFSLWFFWLLGWLEAGFADTLGFTVGKVGQKLNGGQLVATHNYGALVFLVVWSFWIARRHLQTVWQAAVSRDRPADNPGGVMSYRAALITLVLSLVFLGFFAVHMGMSVMVAIPALLFIFVAFFVVAKYMAATGMAYITPPSFVSGQLLESLVGSSWWSQHSVVGVGLLHSHAFGAGARVFGFGMMPHALKVGEQFQRGPKRIVMAAILAIVVGALFSIWNTLRVAYNHAGLKMNYYTMQKSPTREIEAIATRVRAVRSDEGLPPDVEKIAAWGAGFTGAWLLSFLHTRFSWWGLHPVGLAFSASGAATHYWFSIFIVWFAKLLILKWGGVRLYEKAKPFFIGLIVGYVVALMVCYGVDELFPGRWFPTVHDW